jgi:hypothetical protein
MIRKMATSAIIALSLVIAPVVAPTAQAGECNTTSYTWPFCHIGKPSIPRFHADGPRPDLTPTDSVWCNEELISAGPNGVAWLRFKRTKHEIRFWPDYYHLEFIGVVNDPETGWRTTREPVYDSVDCDA